jgi:hypothetical protein
MLMEITLRLTTCDGGLMVGRGIARGELYDRGPLVAMHCEGFVAKVGSISEICLG